MTLPPSLALTNSMPITDATIDTAPSTNGYKIALFPLSVEAKRSPPNNIVAIIVTA